MLHIAIICKTFLKGGAEKQALILTKLLADRGIDVCLVNWYGDKIDKRNLKFIADNSFRYFPMSGKFFKKLSEFRKMLKDQDITIIVSYLTLANFVSGICRLFNRNLITIGGIRNEKLPLYKFMFERILHNHFNDATVFNNFSAKAKFVKRGFDPQKIYVIHNAIDSRIVPCYSRSGNGMIKIVTVGRFVKQKDYETALNAFKNLISRNTPGKFQYNVVGYGPLEHEVRSMTKKLELTKEVNVLINPPDIPEILKRSDIFLSTSLFEGVSNSIMEAMISGLPVIATNVGDNCYLVKDGQNGFLVPCKDVNSIVDKLEYLSGSAELRNEFGRNSISVIENEFSRSRLLENYLDLFSKYLKTKNKQHLLHLEN